MSTLILAIISIVIITNFILSVIILSRGIKNKINFLFGLLALGIVLWSFGILGFYFITPPVPFLSLWIVITHFSAAFIAFIFLFFSLNFPIELIKKKSIFFLLAIFFLIITYLLFNTKTIIGNVVDKRYEINNGYIFYGAYLILYFFLGYLSLFFQLKKVHSFEEKMQVRYVLIGSIFSSVLATTTDLILPFLNIFNYTWLGPVFTLILLFSIAIAIVKHRLFNIRVIATELLVFIIWAFLSVRFLISNGFQERIINGLLLVFVVVFGILLIKSVLREVEQREKLQILTETLSDTNLKLSTRTKYLAALQDFTTSIIESLDFQNTIQSIVNGVSNRFGYLGALLILVSKDGEKIYPAAISQSAASSVALRILPKPLEEYFEFIGQTSSLTAETIKRGEIQFSEDFSNTFSSVPKDILSRIQKTTGIRLTIAIPIKSKGKILGALEVITAKTKADISQEELDVLKTLANQIGIVLDNASLFEETKKLSSYKTELLSIVAHQLKNPLVVVKGYSSLVEDNTIQGVDAMKEVFKKVKSAADKLITLLNNLLDLHHIEDGKMHYEFQKLELNKLLKDISDNFQLILSQKKLQFSFEPFVKDANVSGDIYKLSQVFQNLIDNAIKYTESGWIKVKITGNQQPTTDNRQQIVNNSVNNQGAFLITISDSGRGMAPELISKLFQKFSRGVEEKQILGTGLGLYISKEIVEAHRGKVWAESEGEGKGSKFIVRLPKEEG